MYFALSTAECAFSFLNALIHANMGQRSLLCLVRCAHRGETPAVRKKSWEKDTLLRNIYNSELNRSETCEQKATQRTTVLYKKLYVTFFCFCCRIELVPQPHFKLAGGDFRVHPAGERRHFAQLLSIRSIRPA